MGGATKTDNHNLEAKLDLRRYFLAKYHAAAPPAVIDCCEGEGHIWNQLRREFAVARHWGIDVKRKAGRLQLDSVRLLEQPGWAADVIDIDTYGSPWKHWAALLPNLPGPATVFLTIGTKNLMPRPADVVELEALGLLPLARRLPKTLSGKVARVSAPHCLALAGRHGLRVSEAAEALADANRARYLGVRVERQITGIAR